MLKLKWVAAVLLLLTASVPAGAQEAAVDVKELMAPGPLAEMTLGDPAAPVTVVEYASLTCPHCARFHTEVLPEFKKKYIDTGKVYFVFREFPLDQLSLAAFMLARCAAPGGYFPMVELLFTRQQEWAFVENPAPALDEARSRKRASTTDGSRPASATRSCSTKSARSARAAPKSSASRARRRSSSTARSTPAARRSRSSTRSSRRSSRASG